MGIAKAAVLPEPVSARPIMSRPERASGIAEAWIGVGFLKLSFSQASQSSGITPREEKEGVDDSGGDSVDTSSSVEGRSGGMVTSGLSEKNFCSDRFIVWAAGGAL